MHNILINVTDYRQITHTFVPSSYTGTGEQNHEIFVQLSNYQHQETMVNSVKCFSFTDLKPIVLITDCPANIFSLTTKSHYISAISYLTLKDNCQYRHLSDIMAFLGSRSVYVCITKDSLLNLEYIRFLQNLLTQNYKKYSFNVPRLRALLFDGLYSLPNGLSGYLPIKTEKKNMDALAQFLEEFDTERLKSCESIINKNKHSKLFFRLD